MLVGEALPALTTGYVMLVGAIFLIGVGMTLLQVAGNPIMRDVSEEGRFARNLTFAQFIKGLGLDRGAGGGDRPRLAAGCPGTRSSPSSGWWWRSRWRGSPSSRSTRRGRTTSPRPRSARASPSSANPYVFTMILGLFLYVGAEVGVNSWIATFLNQKFRFDLGSLATGGIAFFFVALSIGRLLGSAVLSFMSARQFLLVTAALSVARHARRSCSARRRSRSRRSSSPASASGTSGRSSSRSLIERMPERSAELSGLMCMAISEAP